MNNSVQIGSAESLRRARAMCEKWPLSFAHKNRTVFCQAADFVQKRFGNKNELTKDLLDCYQRCLGENYLPAVKALGYLFTIHGQVHA